MRKKLMVYLLPIFIDALLKSFPEDQIKRSIDKLIDRLEDHIALTETKVDDSLLPLIYMLREMFNIPDYPDDVPALDERSG